MDYDRDFASHRFCKRQLERHPVSGPVYVVNVDRVVFWMCVVAIAVDIGAIAVTVAALLGWLK